MSGSSNGTETDDVKEKALGALGTLKRLLGERISDQGDSQVDAMVRRSPFIILLALLSPTRFTLKIYRQ
jgi:hypothetical protein